MGKRPNRLGPEIDRDFGYISKGSRETVGMITWQRPINRPFVSKVSLDLLSGELINFSNKNNFCHFTSNGFGGIFTVPHDGNLLFIRQGIWIRNGNILGATIYPARKSRSVVIKMQGVQMIGIKGNRGGIGL